jgi:AcrR family transcriptional regulator
MAKPGGKSRARGSRSGEVTKAQILDAAARTLQGEGFSSTSARAIGRTGGFNHALIFYHFGSVPELLLAALDASSSARLERYREAARLAGSLQDFTRRASELYREDVESGHVAILAEMVAGSSSSEDLRTELAARVEPWIRFTEETIDRFLGSSPLRQLLPAGDLAFLAVASFLGIELMSHLLGDRSRGFRSVAILTGLLDLVAPLLEVSKLGKSQG